MQIDVWKQVHIDITTKLCGVDLILCNVTYVEKVVNHNNGSSHSNHTKIVLRYELLWLDIFPNPCSQTLCVSLAHQRCFCLLFCSLNSSPWHVAAKKEQTQSISKESDSEILHIQWKLKKPFDLQAWLCIFPSKSSIRKCIDDNIWTRELKNSKTRKTCNLNSCVWSPHFQFQCTRVKISS